MVLNVGGNGLDSLQDLICLRELTVLLAANNLLQHVRVRTIGVYRSSRGTEFTIMFSIFVLLGAGRCI